MMTSNKDLFDITLASSPPQKTLGTFWLWLGTELDRLGKCQPRGIMPRKAGERRCSFPQFGAGRRSFNDCASSSPPHGRGGGSAVWVDPWLSIHCWPKPRCEVPRCRCEVLLWKRGRACPLPAASACSTILGLSTHDFILSEKSFKTSLGFLFLF